MTKPSLALCWFLALPLFAEVRLLQETPQNVEIEIHCERPKFTPVTIQGAPYIKMEVAGWDLESETGGPEIPVERFWLHLPEGTEPSFETIETKNFKSQKLNTELAYFPLAKTHNHSRTVTKNQAAYQMEWGEKTVVTEELGYSSRDKLAHIRISPLHYDPTKKEIQYWQTSRVRISFVPTKKNQAPATSGVKGQVARYLALNRGHLGHDWELPSRAVELVIVESTYKSAIENYLGIKKDVGRKIREYYLSKPSAQEVKDIIAKEYKAEIPPTSTLLIGSIDQIPAWRGSSDNTWTDFPYTTLDGDEIPDLSLGRIPAQNTKELEQWLQKAFAREFESRDISQILLTAGQDTSLGCPASVTKVGENIKTADAGIVITKKYRTEVGTQDVISAYNANPNIIVYDGHGDRQGMREIPLIISSLNELKNKTYPLILDIACLNANWPSQGASARNFAESILLADRSGAAGIMASGGSGYGHDFFQTIGKQMATAKNESNKLLNEIGRVIWLAKVAHSKQDRTYWNYYGDPTNSIWQSTWFQG